MLKKGRFGELSEMALLLLQGYQVECKWLPELNGNFKLGA